MERSFSQCGQDLFAVSLLLGKKNGVFLDFGCKVPFEGNNTYLLEKELNFRGLSFDIDNNAINEWKNSDRNSANAICFDLLQLDIQKMLDESYESTVIDYFSFDLEPPLVTVEVLKKIPFDKFRVITFEHDFYRGFDTVKPSRDIFVKNGYRRIKNTYMSKFTNSKIWLAEDWWIHPDVISVPEDILDNEIVELTNLDL